MAKSNDRRKTHSDKFPCTLHKTEQYCKKIKGKFYYFGSDKKIALQRYLEQAACLHSGKRAKPEFTNDFLLKTLCNLYLDHQDWRVRVGKIKLRHIYDQTLLLPAFVRFIGPNYDEIVQKWIWI